MMPRNDLMAVIRATLRAELPFDPLDGIDRLTVAVTNRILARDAELATAYGYAESRTVLLEQLALERARRVPRRGELPASLANLDTPEVIAKRLIALAEIPADSPEDPL